MYNLNVKGDSAEDCPVFKTVQLIGKKWTLIIIRDLLDGKNKFNEFKKGASGITSKILSTRLKELEEEGLVKRRVRGEKPVVIEYNLTEKGKKLKRVVDSMRWFGMQN